MFALEWRLSAEKIHLGSDCESILSFLLESFQPLSSYHVVHVFKLWEFYFLDRALINLIKLSVGICMLTLFALSDSIIFFFFSFQNSKLFAIAQLSQVWKHAASR